MSDSTPGHVLWVSRSQILRHRTESLNTTSLSDVDTELTISRDLSTPRCSRIKDPMSYGTVVPGLYSRVSFLGPEFYILRRYLTRDPYVEKPSSNWYPCISLSLSVSTTPWHRRVRGPLSHVTIVPGSLPLHVTDESFSMLRFRIVTEEETLFTCHTWGRPVERINPNRNYFWHLQWSPLPRFITQSPLLTPGGRVETGYPLYRETPLGRI